MQRARNFITSRFLTVIMLVAIISLSSAFAIDNHTLTSVSTTTDKTTSLITQVLIDTQTETSIFVQTETETQNQFQTVTTTATETTVSTFMAQYNVTSTSTVTEPTTVTATTTVLGTVPAKPVFMTWSYECFALDASQLGCQSFSSVKGDLEVCVLVSQAEQATPTVSDSFGDQYQSSQGLLLFSNEINAFYAISQGTGDNLIIFTFPTTAYSITADCFDIYDPGYVGQSPSVLTGSGDSASVSVNGFMYTFESPTIALVFTYNSEPSFASEEFTAGYSPTQLVWQNGNQADYAYNMYSVSSSSAESCQTSMSISQNWYEYCISFAA